MNELRIGTLKRAPQGFAHAQLLEQPGPARWQVTDAWGSSAVMHSDEEVADWPVVYEPLDDGLWKLMYGALDDA